MSLTLSLWILSLLWIRILLGDGHNLYGGLICVYIPGDERFHAYLSFTEYISNGGV